MKRDVSAAIFTKQEDHSEKLPVGKWQCKELQDCNIDDIKCH